MSRPPRNDIEGSWHHVMNRGAGRQNVFRSNLDRLLFESLLETQLHDRGVEIHAYCLLGNHYHLLVHCPTGGLSDAMGQLSSIYTRRTNAAVGRDGPLFRGRFTSSPIDTDEYLVQSARYIHRNSLDIAPNTSLGAYRWSSYGVYVGARPSPRWLQTRWLIEYFGVDRARFASFVEDAA